MTAWSSQNIETGKAVNSLQIEELKVKGNLDLEKSRQIAAQELERSKFETTLIFEAIKTPSRSDAIRNLKFFVAAGFVSDKEKRISSLKDENFPSLSAPSAQSASRATRSAGTLTTTTKTSGPIGCTGVAVSPNLIVTARICLQEADGVDSITFVSQGKSYNPRVLPQPSQSKLGILKIDPPAQVDTFLDRSRIRTPILGEAVYLAMSTSKSEIILRTCSITSVGIDEEFHHSCDTPFGSAGAIVVAVSDDSLLGIHYAGKSYSGDNSSGPAVGIASKLPAGLSTVVDEAANSKKQ